MSEENQLLREANPPDFRIASPVPQYWNKATNSYEKAEGLDGAIYIHALASKIVDLKSLLTAFGTVTASPTTNTLLERVKVIKTELDALQAQIGEIADAAVAAGAAGSVSAKLRRLTTDLASITGKDFATQATLSAINTQIGDIDAALVDAGAVGNVSAKLRRVTTDISAFLTAFNAEDFASQTTLLAGNAQVGAIADAAVIAGAAGSLSAKMRRVTTDLGTLIGLDFATEATMTAGFISVLALDFATQTTLLAETVQIGDTDAALVAAGAVGSLSSKMRRLTTDLAVLMGKDFATQTELEALKTAFDTEVGMSVYSNSAPGAHAGETIGMTHLNITDGDLYVSTGAAWVLKLEGIWV